VFLKILDHALFGGSIGFRLGADGRNRAYNDGSEGQEAQRGNRIPHAAYSFHRDLFTGFTKPG
jgi:hypothetical protein